MITSDHIDVFHSESMNIQKIMDTFETDRRIHAHLQNILRLLESKNSDFRHMHECALLYITGIADSRPKKRLNLEQIRNAVLDYVQPYSSASISDQAHDNIYSMYKAIANGTYAPTYFSETFRDFRAFIETGGTFPPKDDGWNLLARSFICAPYSESLTDAEISAQLKSFLKNCPHPEQPIAMIRARKAKDLDEINRCAGLEFPNCKIVCSLSSGSTKKVYLGVRDIDLDLSGLYNNLHYIAVKLLRPTLKGIDIMELAGKELDELAHNELKVKIENVFAISNFNINGVIDGFRGKDGSIILYEPYCNRGSLVDHDENFRNGRPIPYRTATDYMEQISNGCKGLIRLGILPVDLKGPNILVHEIDGKIQIRLTDFESNLSFTELPGLEAHVNLGYPINMAPELTCTSDVPTTESLYWSMGIIYYQMLTGKTLVQFSQPKGWSDMRIEQRIREYDRPIKEATRMLGQAGINKKIDDLSDILKDRALDHAQNNLYSLLRMDPSERNNPF